MEPKNEKKEKFKYSKIALDVIRPNKEAKSSYWELAISLAISFLIALCYSLKTDTVSLVRETSIFFYELFLALLAMQLGAYAIFQALLKSRLVYVLHKSNNLLQKANQSFLGVILLYWLSIMVNVILIIFFKLVPDNMVLTSSNMVNIILSTIFLWLYFSYHIRGIFEVRNFAISLYQVFEAHNKISLLEYCEEQENKQKKQ